MRVYHFIGEMSLNFKLNLQIHNQLRNIVYDDVDECADDWKEYYDSYEDAFDAYENYYD